MTNLNRIIDPDNDSDYFIEVRSLLGITSDDLSDAVLKSDIILGMAERVVCKVYVPNWIDILNGSNRFATEALRSCVIIRVCLNILNMPAVQNIMIDQIRLIDIIIKSIKIDLNELKESLDKLFKEQLSFIGIDWSGDYPLLTAFELTDKVKLYDYEVNDSGALQKV
jgi:hypothetical protein